MFGKFFASTFTGSMMAAGPEVFSVWGYVIAHTINSRVELNPRLLAAVIGSTPDRMLSAIELLCSSDEASRSKVNDGKRLIREGEYQYFVPNHEKYRSIRDEEDRREYNRIKKREERERKSNDVSLTVNDNPGLSTLSAKAEAEAEALNTAPQAVHVERCAPDARFRVPDCPYQKILALYHEHLPMLPEVVVFNTSRKANLRSRWVEVCADGKLTEQQGVDWFETFLKGIRKSPFLTGNTDPGRNGRSFKADMEWIFKPSNFAKIVEGRYHGDAK